MQKNKAKEPRLIVGVIILMISNIIVKVIGVLFKIPLHDLLGDRGMSYFNIAYNLFTTLYLVSTAGLPTAISMMVSEARVKGKKLKSGGYSAQRSAYFYSWNDRNLYNAVWCGRTCKAHGFC